MDEAGIEPATQGRASLCSTTELLALTSAQGHGARWPPATNRRMDGYLTARLVGEAQAGVERGPCAKLC